MQEIATTIPPEEQPSSSPPGENAVIGGIPGAELTPEFNTQNDNLGAETTTPTDDLEPGETMPNTPIPQGKLTDSDFDALLEEPSATTEAPLTLEVATQDFQDLLTRAQEMTTDEIQAEIERIKASGYFDDIMENPQLREEVASLIPIVEEKNREFAVNSIIDSDGITTLGLNPEPEVVAQAFTRFDANPPTYPDIIATLRSLQSLSAKEITARNAEITTILILAVLLEERLDDQEEKTALAALLEEITTKLLEQRIASINQSSLILLNFLLPTQNAENTPPTEPTEIIAPTTEISIETPGAEQPLEPPAEAITPPHADADAVTTPNVDKNVSDGDVDVESILPPGAQITASEIVPDPQTGEPTLSATITKPDGTKEKKHLTDKQFGMFMVGVLCMAIFDKQGLSHAVMPLIQNAMADKLSGPLGGWFNLPPEQVRELLSHPSVEQYVDRMLFEKPVEEVEELITKLADTNPTAVFDLLKQVSYQDRVLLLAGKIPTSAQSFFGNSWQRGLNPEILNLVQSSLTTWQKQHLNSPQPYASAYATNSSQLLSRLFTS